MAINTLNDYYVSKGVALPSVSTRASAYSSLGLGSGYTGTAAQNGQLLAKLISMDQPSAPAQNNTPAAPAVNNAPPQATANGGNINAAPTGPAAPVGQAPAANTDFINQLQSMLLNQSGIISSNNTKLEDKINSAISGVTASNEASKAATASAFDRQEAATKASGAQQLTSAMEAQRGFATNTAALKQLTDATTKQVNDLEQRKQEALMQGDAQAASQVASLQFQAIQFQQQAQQQAFSNILGMANFGLSAANQTNQVNQFNASQAQQASQFASTQSFQQQQAVSNIALKYGLSVQPGDTLATITTRAMPYASQEEKLQLQQIQSQIRANDAQTAKAYADAKSGGANVDINAIAQAALRDPNILATIKDPTVYGKVVNTAYGLQQQQYSDTISTDKKSGVSKTQELSNIQNNSSISAADKAGLVAAVETVYGPDAAQPKTSSGQGFSLSGLLDNLTNGFRGLIGEPAIKFN